MDIRKLQRAIVDGLEDVKAQDIVVFNTEHLSPLFERVIVASGASNRQTKALAASVRDAVKAGGMQVMATEGGDNGEWIIVDCGAAVAHIMQPAIREYYRLEEIWGGKSVKIKLGAASTGLVKAAATDDEEDAAPVKPKRGGTGKSGIKPAVKRAGSYKAPANKASRPASSQAAAGKPAAKKAAAKQAASQRAAPVTAAGKKPAAKRGTAQQEVVSRTIVVKPAAKRGAAAKKSVGRAAPGKTAAPRQATARPAAKKAAAKKAAPRRAPGRG